MKEQEGVKPDLWHLFGKMFESRIFEEAVVQLWNQGWISGEMHLGLGEEALVAGVVDHLQDGDAMALDHRGTPPMIMRGVEPQAMLLEFLGHEQGLCRGRGGHMHLFSKPYLAVSSGIVGASAPAAVGFALAGRHLRPGSVAVAFFGEGAMNQGMVLEAMNLASVWKLAVIFVCKDNNWAITTVSEDVTAGNLRERASGLGMNVWKVHGLDVEAVWHAAAEGIASARSGKGPCFLHATCSHLEGHFLGDPLLRFVRKPLTAVKPYFGPLVKSFLSRKGSGIRGRSRSIHSILSLIGRSALKIRRSRYDPLLILRKRLLQDPSRLKQLESKIRKNIQLNVKEALAVSRGKNQ
jgi:pyruvate dehydrogenase E1 component alpha subunit